MFKCRDFWKFKVANNNIQKFPMEKKQVFVLLCAYSCRVESISLGQGQGPIAEKMIHEAMESGNWVFLQNCHLAVSWMLAMEELIKTFSEPGTNIKPMQKLFYVSLFNKIFFSFYLTDTHIHENFRLFLSSMPTKVFPVTVLQNSVKV